MNNIKFVNEVIQTLAMIEVSTTRTQVRHCHLQTSVDIACFDNFTLQKPLLSSCVST
jgi:hypothetical protein